MAKPKPPSAEAKARQEAEAALPKLQRKLDHLLAGNVEDQADDTSVTGAEEIEQDDGEGEDTGEEDEEEDEVEDKIDTEEEGSDEEDEIDTEEEGSDEEDYDKYQDKHILPNQFQIEIVGVCVVTGRSMRGNRCMRGNRSVYAW
jgi:hypothetical protein